MRSKKVLNTTPSSHVSEHSSHIGTESVQLSRVFVFLFDTGMALSVSFLINICVICVFGSVSRGSACIPVLETTVCHVQFSCMFSGSLQPPIPSGQVFLFKNKSADSCKYATNYS